MKHALLWVAIVCLAGTQFFGCGDTNQQDDLEDFDTNPADTGSGDDGQVSIPMDTGTGDLDPLDVDTGTGEEEDSGPLDCDNDTDNPCCVDGQLECWLDVNTGLYWQVAGSNQHWLDASGDDPNHAVESAVEFCAAQRLGGFEGWRIPNINELRTIIEGCPQLGDCDRDSNLCVDIHDPECLEFSVCNRTDPDDDKSRIGVGGSWTQCYDRPFFRPYMPAPFWKSAARFGNGYYVWSTSDVWEKPYGSEPEDPPEPNGRVYTMCFQHGYPHPTSPKFVFHPVYPPSPSVTHCVFDAE